MDFGKSAKYWINRVGLCYAKFLSKREYDTQTFVGINERPVEFAFIFRQLTSTWPKTVLDVGTGMTALPHLMRNCGFLVTATDNISDYWPNGMINRHFHVLDDNIIRTKIGKTFDFITCVSVLEHIRDHKEAVSSMFSLLNPGGYLALTFPYNEERYSENVYKEPGSTVVQEFPFVTQAYSRSELDSWLLDNSGMIVEQEYWRFFIGDYWTCGERVTPPAKVEKEEPHQISCILIRKNP